MPRSSFNPLPAAADVAKKQTPISHCPLSKLLICVLAVLASPWAHAALVSEGAISFWVPDSWEVEDTGDAVYIDAPDGTTFFRVKAYAFDGNSLHAQDNRVRNDTLDAWLTEESTIFLNKVGELGTVQEYGYELQFSGISPVTGFYVRDYSYTTSYTVDTGENITIQGNFTTTYDADNRYVAYSVIYNPYSPYVGTLETIADTARSASPVRPDQASFLGAYADQGNNLYYSYEQRAFIYIWPSSLVSSVLAYDYLLGQWMWTSRSVYPWVYYFADGSWRYLFVNSARNQGYRVWATSWGSILTDQAYR